MNKNKTNKIHLGIVDDHQIVIDGLMALLRGEDDFVLAFATTRPKEVISLIEQNPIHILLTDVMMPEISGKELAVMIRQKFPEVKIMALSMSGQGDLINELIEKAEISGYVLKNIGRQELLNGLKKIAAGGIFFSDEVVEEMQRDARQKKQIHEVKLTEREIEIIRLIEKEYSNRQIADTLFISERTVETHRKNIFRKTNTNNVIGLIKYAYEHRLILK
ncbi:MAG: response regulator transcription factor [Chitinophagaceae bacterium]|nr:response regulator transcription factor [Chitinophagaceae bacterium]